MQVSKMPIDTPFRRFHHICIVVPDIDAAVRFYESVGIGPWQPFPSLEPYRHELLAPDPQAFMQLTYRYAAIGDIQLQLCEPSEGETPQWRYLEAHGSGVFHLGFAVDDVDKAEARGIELGLLPLLHGRLLDRSGFSYFDTSQAGGVNLQVRQSST